MAAYVKQSIGLGTVPNDDTGDDLRAGGDKINDNFDEIFTAITYEASGPKVVVFDGLGRATFTGDMAIKPSTGEAKVSVEGALSTDLGRYVFLRGANERAEIQFDHNTGNMKYISGDVSFGGRHIFENNGVENLRIETDGIASFGSDVNPKVTEMQDLGSATFEWDNIFLQNAATISDERKKNDLDSAEILIPMLRLLDSRMFSRKSRVVVPAVPEKTGQRQKTTIVEKTRTVIEIIDDVPTQRTQTMDVQEPVFKLVTVKDENGVSVKDKDGKVLKHPVPVMEEYVIPAVPEIVVTHGRPHSGWMAQQVKAAMDEAGVTDWAGYAYDQDADVYSLRMMEFISPMNAWLQKLEARLNVLDPGTTP